MMIGGHRGPADSTAARRIGLRFKAVTSAAGSGGANPHLIRACTRNPVTVVSPSAFSASRRCRPSIST